MVGEFEAVAKDRSLRGFLKDSFHAREMAEEGLGSKVRVVRCPECEKLLPELANFAVYRCGGCGATLQGELQSSFVCEFLLTKFLSLSVLFLLNIRIVIWGRVIR